MVDRSKHASMEMRLPWQSFDASHDERQFFERAKFWQDVLPDNQAEQLGVAARDMLVEFNPADELHANERAFSGPMFAVWGRKQTVA